MFSALETKENCMNERLPAEPRSRRCEPADQICRSNDVVRVSTGAWAGPNLLFGGVAAAEPPRLGRAIVRVDFADPEFENGSQPGRTAPLTLENERQPGRTA